MNKNFLPTRTGPYELSHTHASFSAQCSKDEALKALCILAGFDTEVTGLSSNENFIPITEWFEDVQRETNLSNAKCVAETLRAWLTDDTYYLCYSVLEDEIDGKVYISVAATHKN